MKKKKVQFSEHLTETKIFCHTVSPLSFREQNWPQNSTAIELEAESPILKLRPILKKVPKPKKEELSRWMQECDSSANVKSHPSINQTVHQTNFTSLDQCENFVDFAALVKNRFEDETLSDMSCDKTENSSDIATVVDEFNSL